MTKESFLSEEKTIIKSIDFYLDSNCKDIFSSFFLKKYNYYEFERQGNKIKLFITISDFKTRLYVSERIQRSKSCIIYFSDDTKVKSKGFKICVGDNVLVYVFYNVKYIEETKFKGFLAKIKDTFKEYFKI